MGKSLIKTALMIILKPIYWLFTVLVMGASVVTGVVSVVTKFIGFLFVLFGLWWIIVEKTYSTGVVAVVIGIACYVLPLFIVNVLGSAKSFLGGFINELQKS